jgi:hypothetical protein
MQIYKFIPILPVLPEEEDENNGKKHMQDAESDSKGS